MQNATRCLETHWIDLNYDLQLTWYDEQGWRDVLHERDGALADERDGVGADALACGPGAGVGGVDEGKRCVTLLEAVHHSIS